MNRLRRRMGRKLTAGPFRAPKTAELRYAKALTSIMAQIHRELMRRLDLKKARKDAVNEKSFEVEAFGDIALTAMRKGVVSAFDKMSASVKNHTRGALVGIKPSDLGLQTDIDRFRQQNVALMEKAGQAYIDQVRDIVNDPENDGILPKALADLIEERGSVSRSRAELIARDQTLKLNSQITKTRATNAGVTSYVWDTSDDERVRPEHAELEGQTFQFATGAPSLGGLNPGEDFQCRCVSVPVLPEE